jgi:hypothetical protein
MEAQPYIHIKASAQNKADQAIRLPHIGIKLAGTCAFHLVTRIHPLFNITQQAMRCTSITQHSY